MDQLGSAVKFLENRTILVTGATGFLAKIFVEKILRIQPNVKKLYLVLRASDTNSALQRFNTEVVANDVFRVLKEKYGGDLNSFILRKVTVVAGDISLENLGLKDCTDLLEEMEREVDVVVNLAATTKFDERYDVALNTNTLGAKHVLNFAKKCANLKVLLHVSTAYVSGEKEGLILETPYRLGETLNRTHGLDINTETHLIKERLKELQTQQTSYESIKAILQDLGLQRARKYGWPNTYVFTKAMGEMILGNLKGDLPIIIIRPTIITSTYKEPIPGWVEGIKTFDNFAIGYGKGRLTFIPGDPDTILDLIPGDMVVNAMIVAMWARSCQPGGESIYHIGSSLANPLVLGHASDSTVRYFTKNPWINKDGDPVRVGKPKFFTTMAGFRRYLGIRYLLPLKGLGIVNTLFFQYFQDIHLDLDRKIKLLMRLTELYEPYLFSKATYDDTNTENLRKAVKENGVDMEIFYFDPRRINWEDYIVNVHLPGMVKYLLK